MKNALRIILFISFTLPLWINTTPITYANSIERNASAITDTDIKISKSPVITKESADQSIQEIKAIGFVDTDGSKLKAIAIHYNMDLNGATIDTSTYTIHDYGMTLSDKELTQGSNPGAIKKVYINDTPEISKRAKSHGSYVIIETNTAYQGSRFPRSYEITMAVGVRQEKMLYLKDKIITPSIKESSNYTKQSYIGYDPNTGKNRTPETYDYAKPGTYIINGLDGYQLHTIENGTAFHAAHCFDEANGKFWDFDLPYAIYVPKDYNPHKRYGLILHIHDAGSMSSDPMLTLTESQAATNYASDIFQKEAKKQGLDGVIVVCPAITEFYNMDKDNPHYSLRMARDNWTLSCAVPAIWKLLDYITENYSIDKNRIYGSGQSMGGMTIMAMAAQRDNYFAALLPISCKWGNNFNKDYPFNDTVYYNAPADGTVIWKTDSDGNPTDYNNWFYMVSDDNILYLNTPNENIEYRLLYQDLQNITIPTAKLVLDKNTTAKKRNKVIQKLTKMPNKTGIYQAILTGNVGHMSAWFYGHGTPACYNWLLSQNRKTELARQKLPLNQPFILADTQIHTENRIFSQDRQNLSKKIYYPTGKYGSGTEGYNSGLTVLGSDKTLSPGWTPQNKKSSVNM